MQEKAETFEKLLSSVIPAYAGIQDILNMLDSVSSTE
jgi:hypothetical protein